MTLGGVVEFVFVFDQELTTGRVNVFFLFTPTKMDLKTTDWSVFIMSVPYQLF